MLVEERLVELGREEFKNPYGSGLAIRYEAPLAGRPPWVRVEDKLAERLDLVRGVGPFVARRLWEEGYRTLFDLARHPRYGRDAARASAALARRDAQALLAAGARDVELLGLFGPGDAAVIDIETTGLWRVLPVFLVGFAARSHERWEVRQYLARSFEEEAAVLYEVGEALAGRTVGITYNGKAFDEPFVRARLQLHGLAPIRFRLHVDLLHTVRRTLGPTLPDCRLSTVSRCLYGIGREGDVNGEEVPDLYYRYVMHGDEAAIEPVLRHNAIDLYSLAWLAEPLWAAPGRREAAGTAGGDERVS